MRTLMVLLCLTLLSVAGHAEEMTAQQIVDKSWQLYRQAHDEKEQINLTVSYKDGRKEEKSLTRWIKYDDKGEDKVTIKFSKPAMDDGLGLLTWRHGDKVDDQWLKLPSMDKVRRISTSEQEKYFAGTDLTYEDTRQLLYERSRDFTYRTIMHDNQGWQIEATPKAGVASGYSKRILHINDKYAVQSIEYFGKDAKLLKVHQNNEISYGKGGLWRPGKIDINNQLLQRHSNLVMFDRKLNSGLPGDTFSMKYLESSRR